MRLDRATLNTFLTNIGINLCNVGTGILTARLLLPRGRGELATILLWPSILAGLGMMGTNWSLVRESAAHSEKEGDLARTSLALSLFLAITAMALGYFCLPHLLPNDKQHLLGLNRIYLLWIPLNFVTLNLIALDQGRFRWKRFNLVRLSVVIFYFLILVGFWIGHFTQLYYFVIALLVSNCLTAFLLLVLRREEIAQGQASLTLAMTILKRGFPFFLASVGGVVALQMDKALVVSLLSTNAVGFYAVAFAFASAHGSLGSALGVVSFAALANESDYYQQGQFLARVFRQACWLYLAAGSAMALLAPLAIVPLFGAEFTPAVQPAVILVLATTLLALSQILNEGLRGLGKTYPGIGAEFLGGGVVALVGFSIIPVYGLKGMAAAAVLGALGQLLVLVVAVTLIFDLSPSLFWGFRTKELKELYGRILALLPF